MTWLYEPARPWRPLDAAMAATWQRRWPDLPDPLLRLFACVSAASGRGHSALDLAALEQPAVFGLPDWSREQWLALLSSCPAVAAADSNADDSRPFVLDQGLLYLRRHHRDEVRLAAALRTLAQPQPVTAPTAAITTTLQALFPDADVLRDRQALACLLSLDRRLTVVLGGPGTGKTSTVLRLLALHQHLASGSLRIAVAAPTGKAAARVAEAMTAATNHLALSESQRAALPSRATTLHRLLGADAQGVRFRYGAHTPLPYDLVVLDEASMVDLALFARLVEALPAQARLIVLGDPDQLEAVESGAVLAELAQLAGDDPDPVAVQRAQALLSPPSSSATKGTVAACVLRLNRNWRFGPDSGIGQLSRAVQAGDAQAALAVLQQDHVDLRLEHVTAQSRSEALRHFARAHYAAGSTASPEQLLAAHAGFRVLCATRAESAQVNAAIAAALGQRLRLGQPEAGLPFLIERNDPLRGLHNGDTGIFAGDPFDLRAWLPDGQGPARALAPHEIGAWQPAYAMTVHRAQGSEYDAVMVSLPDRLTPVLSRAWLYTAVSRARHRLHLLGSADMLAAAMARRDRRVSGLAQRLSR